ncbi:MAG TPA: ACP S-malonyltransferase [Atribacter sp.]|jgi:[acyl-carrier-protein] S-malonyltransferase|nr:ACP S-malonyltransferase [Atribacter sp.]
MDEWVFLFPGQGSQRVGMVQDFLDHYPHQTRGFFNIAQEKTGVDLLKLSLDGPEEELNLTYNTQPALLTLSALIYQVMSSTNSFIPVAVAGHSLGEYSALIAAGSINFSDAVYLVRKRGEIMQDAVPAGNGTMVAVIGLPDQQLEPLIQELSHNGKFEIANYNSSEQVVFSLEKTLVPLIMEKAKSRGAKKIIELRVSAPFHSSFMREAAREFQAILSQISISRPQIKFLSNVTADYADDPEKIRELLNQQMVSPVRWKEIMDRLYQDGYRKFVEIGPGNVLSKLFKREYDQVETRALQSVTALNEWMKEAS